MLGFSAIAWLMLVVAAVFVGVSKTALPGSVTVSIAIFAALLPAKESTGTLLVLLMVGDLVAVWIYRRDADWATLRRLLPAVVGGVLLGVLFLALADDASVRRVIGVILLVVIGVTLLRRWKERPSRGREPALPSGFARHLQTGAYGTLGGFTTMVANAGGPVMSMYFIAVRFPIKRFLGTAAWFFALVNLGKLPFSAGLGLITGQRLLLDLVLVPGVLGGAAVGRWMVLRMDQEFFERLVIGLTIVGAVYLLV